MSIGEVEVLRRDGSPVALGHFWKSRDCVVMFLRHFACPSCSARLTALLPRLHELIDLGAGVVFVGPGSVRALGAFAARMRLEEGPIDLVVSPDLSAYRAADLERSRWSAFGPASVAASIALYVTGHGATRHDDDGDILQQGGVVYVTRDGAVGWRHADRHLGDEPDWSALFQVVLASAAARPGVLV
jgi:peroxiredoxin